MISKLLLPLLLLLASPVLSQEVSSSFRDFSLGINDNTTTIALKPNESPDAMNVVIDEPWGNLKTRRGTLTCGNTPSGRQVTNAHEYIRSNGNHELILTDNISVWSTLDCVSFSTIATGLSDLAQPYFDTFRDKLWIVNKSTFTITWDGSTAVYLDGSGTKPNPVKAQYVTHWKERVWLARTTTEPSAVYFSALTNEDGVNIDPSISSQAWPSANAFNIAQDDGSPIYGMKVFKDNLFIFKETGIWRIIFESVYNTQVVKSVSNVGCKFHDSIVELDNLLYFVGPDGIYKFDGNDVVRISDNITTTFKRLKQPSRLDKFQLWDTPADWVEGTLVNISTAINSGSLSLYNNATGYLLDNFTDGNYTSSPIWTFGGANNHFLVSDRQLVYDPNLPGAGTRSGYLYTSTTTSGYGGWEMHTGGFNSSTRYSITDFAFISDSNDPATMNGYVARYTSYPGILTLNKVANGVYTVIGSTTCNGSDCRALRYSISRTPDGIFSINLTPTLGTIVTTTITATDNTYKSSNYIILNCNTIQTVGGRQGGYFDNIYIASGYPSSGSFTSQISTFTGLTQWRTFDIDETLNGQSILYSVRTGPTATSFGPYRSITSGAIISTSTADKNFQWKAELTTYDNSKTPLINAVTANYQEGDVTATRLSALNYNNRYMVTASTTPANLFNDTVLVKSKSPLDSWVVYDQQISAFTKWNTYLYGGVSNSSDVARMDYGSNDNGRPINAYWTWGDSDMGVGLSYKKTLSEIYAFYVPSLGNNTQLQYSRDGGANWNSLLLNTNTTGSFGTKRLLFNGGNANAFRFRILNNTLDESFNFLGFNAYGTKYMSRE